jgi:hypothetical protein
MISLLFVPGTAKYFNLAQQTMTPELATALVIGVLQIILAVLALWQRGGILNYLTRQMIGM